MLSLMGALFFLTQYLQGVQGLSPLETGLRFIPIALGVIIVSPISAQLLPRFGTRYVTAAGLAVTAVGMEMLAAMAVALVVGLPAAAVDAVSGRRNPSGSGAATAATAASLWART